MDSRWWLGYLGQAVNSSTFLFVLKVFRSLVFGVFTAADLLSCVGQSDPVCNGGSEHSPHDGWVQPVPDGVRYTVHPELPEEF